MGAGGGIVAPVFAGGSVIASGRKDCGAEMFFGRDAGTLVLVVVAVDVVVVVGAVVVWLAGSQFCHWAFLSMCALVWQWDDMSHA